MREQQAPSWGIVPESPSSGPFGAMLVADATLRRSGPPPLLRGLSKDEIALVMSAGRRKILNRGERLFSQGSRQDGIFLIESGRVKVFYTAPTGREITLAYWHPGNFVGGPEVFKGGLHVWSGIAAATSRVLHLPGDVLRGMAMSMPALAIGIIEGLVFKGKCYSALAQMLGTRSATERLAILILHLVNLYGIEEPGGILVAAPFTHADLAHMTGVTRQSVTTTLKVFSKKGAIDTRGTNLFVSDVDFLAKVRDAKMEA
jgi:CRP/FNR family transcriptional regulator, cyclic AMP receptor protein